MPTPKGTRLGGRQKGSRNKIPSALKDMILAALSNVGGVDYLTAQAGENPVAFMALIGKVLPLQLTGENGGPLSVNIVKFSQ